MIEMDVKTNSSLSLDGVVGGGGEKLGVLHEGAATASDRKSQRRASANVNLLRCEKLCAV